MACARPFHWPLRQAQEGLRTGSGGTELGRAGRAVRKRPLQLVRAYGIWARPFSALGSRSGRVRTVGFEARQLRGEGAVVVEVVEVGSEGVAVDWGAETNAFGGFGV